MYAICFIKSNEKTWLMTDEKGIVQAWKTEKEALGFFENAYNANHDRSYEASMSACYHFIEFQPKIVTIKNAKELEPMVKFPVSVYHLWGVAGGFYAVPVNKKGNNAWENGKSPALISP